MSKLKMSNRRFRAITIPLISILSVVCVLADVGMNMFSVAMDDYLGKGAAHIAKKEGTDSIDSNWYQDDYADYNESRDASYVIARQVQDEGSVLLKNNGVLPLAKNSSITPFGYSFASPSYGQSTASGSAKWTVNPITPKDGLTSCFEVNNDIIKLMKRKTPESPKEATGTTPAVVSSAMGNFSNEIKEYPGSFYENYYDAMKGTTGVVLLSRSGSESRDKKYDGYDDGTENYLDLSANEKDTIKCAKEHCDKVVVVIASSATMQLGALMSGDLEVDAILQVGHVGEKGYAALGPILCGEVNPSGRTVDTWARDLAKDPSYPNFGSFTYTNSTIIPHTGTPEVDNGDGTYARFFVEYQEDMYMGYRYYETADVMDNEFVYGELDDKGAAKTEGSVLYPFGYGLSYTTFDQKIKSYSDSGDDITMTVTVTNTGSVAGKEVVQAYYSSPYTDFDKTNRIEKPACTLAAFEKTSMLDPNQSEDVTLTFPKEDMASYCYTRSNADGTKGAYVLENGAYEITLRSNSHDVIETKSTTIASTIWYDSTNIRKSESEAQSVMEPDGTLISKAKNEALGYVAAHNEFEDSNRYMTEESNLLSRADWKGTFPTMYENRKKACSETTKALFGIEESFDPQTDALLGNVEGSEIYQKEEWKAASAGLNVSDMRGVDYYDTLWDTFLNQLDFSDSNTLKQVMDLMGGACYATTGVDALGLQDLAACDGANGIKAVKSNEGMDMTATYGYAPLMASTWNKELLYKVGNMFGKEAMETGMNIWYSPAIDLHRNQFAGRIYEYYSEDPLLTGKLAAQVISGAGDAGMICEVKHFALNEQETNREFFLNTWADEQTMRELYLKAFEIPFKEAKMTIKYYDGDSNSIKTKTMRAATATMAAQNDIGATIGHGNYALLTKLLRQEWGFDGFVHSDMYIWGGEKNMYDLTYRSGCDLFLTYASMSGFADSSSATSHYVMRRAMHNLCYAVANSAAMQGVAPGSTVYYDMSPWQIYLISGNVVCWILVAGGITWIILRAFDEKKHPENYKHKETV